jgi:membrane AbrB-like protein
MVVSSLLHATGASHAVPPPWLAYSAFAVMGLAAGERFSGASYAMLRQAGLASIGGVVVSFTVAAIFVAAVLPFVTLPTAQVILAFTPGGLDSMASLALSMHLDSAFVAVHQFGRFLFLTGLLPVMAKVYKQEKRAEPPAAEARPD